MLMIDTTCFLDPDWFDLMEVYSPIIEFSLTLPWLAHFDWTSGGISSLPKCSWELGFVFTIDGGSNAQVVSWTWCPRGRGSWILAGNQKRDSGTHTATLRSRYAGGNGWRYEWIWLTKEGSNIWKDSMDFKMSDLKEGSQNQRNFQVAGSLDRLQTKWKLWMRHLDNIILWTP